MIAKKIHSGDILDTIKKSKDYKIDDNSIISIIKRINYRKKYKRKLRQFIILERRFFRNNIVEKEESVIFLLLKLITLVIIASFLIMTIAKFIFELNPSSLVLTIYFSLILGIVTEIKG